MSNQQPETLIKFLNTETAKKVLSSQTLRWSSPSLFADPFELNHLSQLNFDPHTLLDKAIKMAESMIFSPDAPKGDTPLIHVIRRWRDEERFASPQEAHDVLRELLSKVVDHRQKVIDIMMSDWRKFVRTLRVCCFTEKVDSVAAWQNYADSHRGIAIRFNTDEHSPLENCVPVNYKAARPQISTLQSETDFILGGDKPSPQHNFEDKFSVRSPLYASEKEWRCFSTKKEQPGIKPSNASEWFDDKKFERNDISAVYFGANISAKDKKEIYNLLKDKYTKSKIYQAQASSTSHQLEFERITEK